MLALLGDGSAMTVAVILLVLFGLVWLGLVVGACTDEELRDWKSMRSVCVAFLVAAPILLLKGSLDPPHGLRIASVLLALFALIFVPCGIAWYRGAKRERA